MTGYIYILFFANREETVVVTPVTAPAVEVEAAPQDAPVEIRHIEITIDLTNGTESNNWELELLFGVFGSVGKQVFNLGGFPGVLGVSGDDLRHCILRIDETVKVEDFHFKINLPFSNDRESLVSDTAARPVIATNLNHISQGHRIVHSDDFRISHDNFGTTLEDIKDLSEETSILGECLNLLIVPIPFTDELAIFKELYV